MRRVFLLLFSLALALSACGSAQGMPHAGAVYVAVDATGLPLVESAPPTIRFSGKNLDVDTGCNNLAGTFAWSGDTLRLGEYSVTEMGCEPDLMVQEESVVALLTSGPRVIRSGETLTVTGTLAGGTPAGITFLEREVLALENTRWELDGLGKKTRAGAGEGLGADDEVLWTAVPFHITSSLAFTDTEALIEYGCNSGGGGVSIGPDTLTFGELVTTLMACDEEQMMVEDHVAAVLRGVVSYSVNDGVLTISKGSLSLQYSPVP